MDVINIFVVGFDENFNQTCTNWTNQLKSGIIILLLHAWDSKIKCCFSLFGLMHYMDVNKPNFWNRYNIICFNFHGTCGPFSFTRVHNLMNIRRLMRNNHTYDSLNNNLRSWKCCMGRNSTILHGSLSYTDYFRVTYRWISHQKHHKQYFII